MHLQKAVLQSVVPLLCLHPPSSAVGIKGRGHGHQEHHQEGVSQAVKVRLSKGHIGKVSTADGKEEGKVELRLGVHGLMQWTVWMGKDALQLFLSQVTTVGRAVEGPSNGNQKNGMVLKSVL